MRTIAVSMVLMGLMLHPIRARGELVLGAATTYSSDSPQGDIHGVPAIVRSTGDKWELAVLPGDTQGILLGVTFSTPDTAWAYGATSDGPLLLTSDDAGVSWRNATALLPLPLPFLSASFPWASREQAAGSLP